MNKKIGGGGNMKKMIRDVKRVSKKTMNDLEKQLV